MMKKIVLGLALVAAGMLAACGGSIKSSTALDTTSQSKIQHSKLLVRHVDGAQFNVPEHILTQLKSYLESELGKRQLLAAKGAADANMVDIKITYYRMRGGMARDILGVLAGKDGIQADVSIYEPKSNKPMNTIKASSYNFVAAGTEDDMARLFAKVVAKEIEKEVNK